jgi:peroxiredoxin family protein
MAGEPLGILLLSVTHERVHAAFSLAAASAALGRPTILFATAAGIRALLAEASANADVARDTVLESRGVAGLATLRAAALELGVRLLACDAALKAEALEPAALLPAVELSGLATFLAAVGAGQIVSI